MSIVEESPSAPAEQSEQSADRARRRARFEAGLVTAGSSVSAVLIAFFLSALLLLVTGKSPSVVSSTMWEVATTTRFQYEMIERAVPFIIAGVAFAVAAKMNLFNIGVEGQYLFGMFWAAVIGANVELPALLHVPFILMVAMLAGAFWAGIAGYLKVRLGVSEIISTIMLNAIALQITDWLFNDFFRFDDASGTLDVRTKPIPETGWMPDFVDGKLNSYLVIALIVCVVYYFLVFKSRFGFRLRASGLNATAASTSGISSGRMVMIAMLISGAIAGLAGLQYLLGEAHSYGPARPSGYGFAGLSVALLGRNNPIGIILAGLLWGFLEASAGPLQLDDIPRSIVNVIQGITLFSVVIVNSVISRWYTKRTTEAAAARLSMEAAA